MRWWSSLWIISTNIRILRCDVTIGCAKNRLDRTSRMAYNQDSAWKRRVLIGNFKERDTFWCEYLKMEHQEDHL